MHNGYPTRRQLIRVGAAAAAALPLLGTMSASSAAEPVAQVHGDPWHGLKIAVASYTFRKRPLEPTIAGIRRVDLSYVSIKEFHLALKSTAEERKAVARKFSDAGISPLSCGVIGIAGREPSVREAFEYARDAGIPTIVCSPAKDALPLLDKYVKEFDLRAAIHNHGPGDKWASPNDVMQAIENLDKRIGLCIDVGHTARAKVDPAECIRKYASRLYDVHLKDLESLDKDAKPVEVGRGVLDIRGILAALIDVKYPHLVSFEYEKDGDDPLPGLAESVGYTRGLLSMTAAREA